LVPPYRRDKLTALKAHRKDYSLESRLNWQTFDQTGANVIAKLAVWTEAVNQYSHEASRCTASDSSVEQTGLLKQKHPAAQDGG
jgi:hypothetical protein